MDQLYGLGSGHWTNHRFAQHGTQQDHISPFLRKKSFADESLRPRERDRTLGNAHSGSLVISAIARRPEKRDRSSVFRVDDPAS